MLSGFDLFAGIVCLPFYQNVILLTYVEQRRIDRHDGRSDHVLRDQHHSC